MMRSKVADIKEGTKFGKLIVVCPDDKYNKGRTPSKWKLVCICTCCNKRSSVLGYNLLSGNTTKCKACSSRNKNRSSYVFQEFVDCGEYFRINLKEENLYFLIDRDDWDKIKYHSWYYSKRGYATSRIDGKLVTLHQYLLGQKGIEIDHKDRNKLNNRRSNLRISQHYQNMGNVGLRSDNSSGYKGVRWLASRNLWESNITYKKKRYYIGKSKDPLSLAKKYAKKEIELRGDYAFYKDFIFPDSTVAGEDL